MKTEQALMCVLFVLCTLVVIGALATMLSIHVPPAQFAHAAASLPASSG